MDRARAASLIAELFEDGGASILAEGGGPPSWEEALAPMPPEIYGVKTPTPGLTLLTLARDLWSQAGQLQMASAVTRGLLAWYTEQHGEEYPEVYAELGALGALALRAGRHDHAGRLLEQAYSGLRSVVGGRDLRLSIVGANYGLYLAQMNDFEAAEVVLTKSYKIRKRLQPKGIASVAGQLGEVRLRLGMYQEGLECLREAWHGHMVQRGAQHPQTIAAAFGLAKTLNAVKKYREAAPIWRDLLRIANESGHQDRIAEMGFELGIALFRSNRKEEGIRRIDDAVRWTRTHSQGASPHPALAERLTVHAELQIDAGRVDEAEGLLREAAAVEARSSGDASVAAADRNVTLGNFLMQLNRVGEGLGYLESACMLLSHEVGAQHPATARAAGLAAMGFRKAMSAAADTGDKRMATEMYHHASGVLGPILGFDHPEMVNLRQRAIDHQLKV